jgi:hypothetical protein
LKKVNFGAWPTYTAAGLGKLMGGNTKDTVDAHAAHFVSPILFPIDLFLLVSFAGFTAMVSLILSGPAQFPAQWIMLLPVIPLVYLACDLTENCLFARMLMLPSATAITDGMVWVARVATALKLLFGGLALVQVLWLGLRVYFLSRS